MLDWDSAFADLDRAVFPILTGVCPYETTVFNSWQVPNLPPARVCFRCQSHSLIAAMVTVASYRTASLSYLVATAR
jgi:hypothetical protein